MRYHKHTDLKMEVEDHKARIVVGPGAEVAFTWHPEKKMRALVLQL